MNTSLIQDQSQFAQAQETLGAPPELEKHSDNSQESKSSKKKGIIISVIVGLVFLVLFSSLVVLQQANKPTTNNLEVTPTPTKAPQSTKLQSELQRLEVLVKDADPELPPLAPPPIDMDVSF